jgi:hypothetical protein
MLSWPGYSQPLGLEPVREQVEGRDQKANDSGPSAGVTDLGKALAQSSCLIGRFYP